MRHLLVFMLYLAGFQTILAQAPVREMPYGVTVIPLVLDGDLIDPETWLPGDEIWLEIRFLVSPNGEPQFVEPAEKVFWLGEKPVLLLGASGQELPRAIVSRGIAWVEIWDGATLLNQSPIQIYPRKQRLRFTGQAAQVRSKLAGALPGVDATYLAQVANFLAGNLATLDVTGTSYSVSGFGEVISSSGEWTGLPVPPNQNLFETVNADTGTTTADSLTDTLTINGGGNVTTELVGDTLTITGSDGDSDDTNELQNLFQTVNADTGTTTADTQTDALNINGSGIVSTSLVGDTLTIDATEVDGDDTNELQNLFQSFTANSGSTTADSQTDNLTVVGSGIVSTSLLGDTLTIDATEADGDETNELQNLFQTIIGNSGMTVADSQTDALSVIGTGSVTTSVSGDTLTITGNGLTAEVDGSTTNELQNLFQTVFGDSGSTTANSQTDALTIAGSGIVSTSVSGDTLTVSASESQNLFQNVNGDSGSTSANSTTDTLTIAGGAGLTTSVSGDTVAINFANDSLDFAQFSDAMTMDASTTIDMDTNDADLNLDSQTLFIDASANRIGVGTDMPSESLHVDGGNLLQTPANPVLLGTRTGYQDPRGVAALGNYAYIVENNGNDLLIVDFTRPDAPTQVGSVNTGGQPEDIFIAGCLAYVIDSNADDMRIFDLSTPSSPQELSRFGVGGFPISIFVSGSHAYVVGPTSSDLRIIDVTNPRDPRLLSTLALGTTPSAVYVAGAYAYVVDETSNDLKVIDVSDPTAPALTGSVGIGDQPTGLAVSGRYAYVVDAISDDLKVIDIEDPTSPNQVGSLGLGSQPNGIQVTGGFAYVIDAGSDDLKVIDIGDPTSPSLVTNSAIGSNPLDLEVSGRYALVVDEGSNDLKVLDISGAEFTALKAHSFQAGRADIGDALNVQGRLNVGDAINVGKGGLASSGDFGLGGRLTQTPATPFVLGRVSVGTQVSDIQVSGNYAYVIDGKVNGSLYVIDISNPTAPEIVGSVVAGTLPIESRIAGRYAYIVDIGGNRIRIIDVADPSNPVQVGNVPAGDEGTSVFVSGKYLYHVAATDQDMEIWDVTDPTAPFEVGSIAAGTQPTSVFVSGTIAYVTDNGNNELLIFDVENPASPAALGSVGFGAFPDSVRVIGRYAYVVERTGTDFYIVDVADPSSPSVVGFSDYSLGGTIQQAFISGRYAYIPDSNSSKIHIVDIADPTNPVQVKNYDLGGSPSRIYISGRYGYVLDATADEMIVLDLGGAEISTLEAGNVKADNVQVLGDIEAKGNLNVTTGIHIGGGGLYSEGNMGLKGIFSIANNIAPTSSPTNQVQLYAQNVSSSSELRVRDEAGNVTTLSPHNFSLIGESSEPLAWSYYSERDGQAINVDMLKAIRLIEQLSGEKLVYLSGTSGTDVSQADQSLLMQLQELTEKNKALAQQNKALWSRLEAIEKTLGMKDVNHE